MNGEQTKQKIAELELLRLQIRRWRSATVLVILIIVFTCVWTVISSLRSLTHEGPHQELFMKEFVTGLNRSVLPPAQDIAKQAFSDLTPVVQDELKKLNGRAPEVVAALQKEGKALADSLPRRAENVLDASFTSMMKSREAKIKKMYPNLSDDKVGLLIHNLIEQGSVNMASVMDDMFKPQEDVFQEILADLYQIQEDKTENAEEDKPTWEMAVLLFDVVREDLKDMESTEYGEALEETGKKTMETVKETVEHIAK